MTQSELSSQLPSLVAGLLIFGHCLGLAAEWRVHRRNWGILQEHGAAARRQRLMSLFYGLTLVSVPLLVAYGIYDDARPGPTELMLGLGLIALSQALRRWAIASLGAYWTMHLVEVEGLRPLNVGPYRWLKSPEYISRVSELIGVTLATASYFPGVILLYALSALALRARSSEDALLYQADRVSSRGLPNP